MVRLQHLSEGREGGQGVNVSAGDVLRWNEWLRAGVTSSEHQKLTNDIKTHHTSSSTFGSFRAALTCLERICEDTRAPANVGEEWNIGFWECLTFPECTRAVIGLHHTPGERIKKLVSWIKDCLSSHAYFMIRKLSCIHLISEGWRLAVAKTKIVRFGWSEKWKMHEPLTQIFSLWHLRGTQGL